MATIDSYDFKGKRAIVRVDFNVPLDENGKITDDTRIRGALPTLKKVLADGGSLVIMSHMGKPKGKVNPKFSLSQIVDAVSEKLGVPVKFAPDCAKAAEAAAALKPGEALMLENLRFYPEEEGKPVGIEKEDPAYEEAKKAMKASQKEFAKTLASYADCYINDAFGTAHRKHASTAVIADYFDAGNKMLGYLMEKEVKAVDNILSDIKRPFTAIMGGSKVSTKIGIIENLMDKVDNLILCGGMTFTFAKAQGGKIGNSICEDDKLQLALDIIAKAKAKGVNLVLGTDCVAADAFSNDANTQICPVNDIPDGWEGMDAGPASRKAFAAAIEGAKTILWNGPAGVFEFDKFAEGSRAIAEAIAKATAEGAFSLIGGGDSVACINKFGMADQVSYISTGGGALLEAIEGKELPGVAAICKNNASRTLMSERAVLLPKAALSCLKQRTQMKKVILFATLACMMSCNDKTAKNAGHRPVEFRPVGRPERRFLPVRHRRMAGQEPAETRILALRLIRRAAREQRGAHQRPLSGDDQDRGRAGFGRPEDLRPLQNGARFGTSEQGGRRTGQGRPGRDHAGRKGTHADQGAHGDDARRGQSALRLRRDGRPDGQQHQRLLPRTERSGHG